MKVKRKGVLRKEDMLSGARLLKQEWLLHVLVVSYTVWRLTSHMSESC